MLCLSDSIRHDAPSVQQLLRTIEEAHTLTRLILAVWPFARVLARHIVEYVLAERAQRPIAWPPCPTCGTRAAQSRVCPARAHEPVWAHPLAPTRRTVSPRV